MYCVNCKKAKAVIHYAEVIDGQIKKLDLCEKCALEKGIGTNLSFSMADLLGGMTDAVIPEKGVFCKNCSMTLDEFRKCGRLGCSKCYDYFHDTLIKMIEQIHRATVHKGKIPDNLNKGEFNKENILALEKDLQKAIKDEDYEKAAFLRDEIKRIRTKLK